jgi:O-antigen ligase
MDSILFVLLLLWFYEERFKNYGKLNSFPLTTTPIALFLLACLLSFFNSNDVELSIYGFVEGIKGFVFYFYIANNIKDEKDIKLVLISLQLSIALIGAICILEAALETNFNTAFESVTQDPYTTLFRSAGLSTPTLTAGYLAAIIPLASINYFFIKNNILKISLLISVTMALFGLLLTFTRAAWVSLAVGSVPLVFLLFRWRILKLRQVGLLILVIGTIAFFHHKNISLRFSEGLDNLYARYSIMLVAINMVKANPVLGVGLNTYQEEMDEYMPTSLPHHFMYVVHNKYMYVWSETGSIGFLCFLWIWLVVFWSLYKLSKSEIYLFYVTTAGLFSAFIVMGIHMLFESYASANRMYIFWLCIGILTGIRKLHLDKIGKTDQKYG